MMFCQTSEMEDAMFVLPLMHISEKLTEDAWMVFSSDV